MSQEFVSDIWQNIPASSNTLIFARKEIRENCIEFVSGALGGAASLAVGHPLDTVKTITQNATKKMVITEGIAGVSQHGYKTFYRGLSIPMWSYAAVNACAFASYKCMQRIIDPNGTSTGACVVAGAFAGMVQLVPGTPVDVIKIHMQNDAIKMGSLQHKGPATYIKEIIEKNGTRGLYRGVGIHALRDVPVFIIYFYSYELFYDLARKKSWGSSTSRAFVSGAIAGALSWVLLIPQDVMKTRIQSGMDKNIIESFKALRNIGKDSFFRGGTLLTVRALLVNAITFAVYDKCSKRLQALT